MAEVVGSGIPSANAQKRGEQLYPPEAVVVFNQKVREAEPGAKGTLADEERSGYQIFLRPASESSVHSIGDFPSG